MKIIISSTYPKIKVLHEEIKDYLNRYFLYHILQLENTYNTRLNWVEITLDAEDIQKLKEFGFDDLIEKLKAGKTIVVSFASNSIRCERKFCIKPLSEKYFDDTSVYRLVECLANRFVYQNLPIAEFDAICEFWCNLISKIPIEEERVAKELKNKFIQTNVYKQVIIREKF